MNQAQSTTTENSNAKLKLTRRTFLKGATGVALAGAACAGGYFALRDCIRVAIVGAGARGNQLAEIIRKTGYYTHRYGRIMAVVDVNESRGTALRDKHAPSAVVLSDHRQILDRSDIDAVIVSCADHWHAAIAIDAMKAGKSVYLEKPMSNTIHESYELVRVAKETKSRILVGTQQRNDAHFRTAAELAMNGRLGKISKAKIVIKARDLPAGPFLDSEPPSGLDWDRFVGPAPTANYSNERYTGWHFFWDYGGGELTNWGIHHFDCALWSLGLDQSIPATVHGISRETAATASGYECPGRVEYKLVYPNGTEIEIVSDENESQKDTGLTLIGESGELFVSRSKLLGEPVRNLDINPLPKSAKRMHPNAATMQHTTVNHICHFWDVVRGASEPVSSVESCHHANIALHMANISMRVGKPLQWNASEQTFLDDASAIALVNPPRRNGFELKT